MAPGSSEQVAGVPVSADQLKQFVVEEILHQDPLLHTINLLGTLPLGGNAESEPVPAIVLLQKTPFSLDLRSEFAGAFARTDVIDSNDIYHWLHGWFTPEYAAADVKMTVIAPATDVHVRKYRKQKSVMIRETPELYREVTKPYIDAFPPSRIQWVYNILSHTVEAERILYEDPSPTSGFIIIPDLKWDRKTLSSLYLVAIAHNGDIKSLRDLRKTHLGMLRSIRREAARVVREQWGVDGSVGLRLFVHYQPSYYHFHVHIVSVDYVGFSGMNVGQAHLLDDIISLLELDPGDGPSVFERMTLTYALGEGHALSQLIRESDSYASDL
ncbi:hypothetical protein BOTBODRAFT_36426 [Botryobasidium botryosum FD-172 SS1]|uniref:m7GpppX diphosphatase n=1 Tax=Botryobasidium botryosum (strain FD-172 SS1) TaxID=930990 RepID=A0A067M6N3_BOTB1|nr:hypothetical protein BOTBODRAFT_36426 [Botryobasidium botryosum FD-172 SS1]